MLNSFPFPQYLVSNLRHDQVEYLILIIPSLSNPNTSKDELRACQASILYFLISLDLGTFQAVTTLKNVEKPTELAPLTSATEKHSEEKM